MCRPLFVYPIVGYSTRSYSCVLNGHTTYGYVLLRTSHYYHLYVLRTVEHYIRRGLSIFCADVEILRVRKCRGLMLRNLNMDSTIPSIIALYCRIYILRKLWQFNAARCRMEATSLGLCLCRQGDPSMMTERLLSGVMPSNFDCDAQVLHEQPSVFTVHS